MSIKFFWKNTSAGCLFVQVENKPDESPLFWKAKIFFVLTDYCNTTQGDKCIKVSCWKNFFAIKARESSKNKMQLLILFSTLSMWFAKSKQESILTFRKLVAWQDSVLSFTTVIHVSSLLNGKSIKLVLYVLTILLQSQ